MSSPIFLSSGDVIADRRFEWARDREAKGDLTGAADLLMQALELAPSYASAWFMLGELRERLGDRAGAVAAFGQAKAADPQDVHGAALRLTRLGVRSGGAMGEGYVRALFDGYAPRFDQVLTVGLNYRAPELLFRAIEGVHSDRRMKFGSVLDLGCGTGLRDTLRYAHSEAHVRAALVASGLNPLSLDFASTRVEKGVPVPGLIVVAGH